MKNSTIIWIVIVIVVVVALGAWYWTTGQSNSSSANVTAQSSTVTTSVAAAPANIVALNTASTSALGTFLVATNGMTLYKYTEDSPSVSVCTGQCAVIWPPYTVPASEASSSLVGVAGANGQMGVITRADGTYQVTYDGMPLYFYDKDTKAGDTTGQGVGGTWFVVNP